MNSQDDLGENLSVCRELCARAAAQGARVVLLPENFACFGSDAQRRAIAERLGDTKAPIQATLAELGRVHGLFVIGGGFPELADGAAPYNTCVVFSPAGECCASYRKLHLFDVSLPSGQAYNESAHTSPGSEPVVAEVLGFRLGLSICYDLRFPELYRALVERGAQVLLVPSAFTEETGKHHWQVLLRARAIESQAFVIAANQVGEHPGNRRTYGHSMIVDPWGLVLAELGHGTGVVTSKLGHERLHEVRTRLPALRHRRL
jgi:deaminated glutathione amidase